MSCSCSCGRERPAFYTCCSLFEKLMFDELNTSAERGCLNPLHTGPDQRPLAGHQEHGDMRNRAADSAPRELGQRSVLSPPSYKPLGQVPQCGLHPVLGKPGSSQHSCPPGKTAGSKEKNGVKSPVNQGASCGCKFCIQLNHTPLPRVGHFLLRAAICDPRLLSF